MKHFALIDPRLSGKVISGLKHLDIEPFPVPLTPLVEPPVSGHPDIQIFIHEGVSFVHPVADTGFLKVLGALCDIKYGSTKLSMKHPGDIAYNIAVTGRYAIHRNKYTDPVINEYLESRNLTRLDVRQGYSKCSTLIVDSCGIITADRSIHTAATENGIDSLLINPGYIKLPGYKYGFIGGASGRFENLILFTGNIDHHPDRELIYCFIESRGLSVKLLSDEPALDAGSILIGSY